MVRRYDEMRGRRVAAPGLGRRGRGHTVLAAATVALRAHAAGAASEFNAIGETRRHMAVAPWQFLPPHIDAGSLRLWMRRHGAGLHAEPATAFHCWHLHVGGRGEGAKRTGRRGVDGPFFAGAAAFVPAGLPVNWCVSFALERLVIGLHPDVVEAAARRHGKHRAGLVERAPLHDPALDHLIQWLAIELDSERRLAPSLADALTPLLAMHMARRYSAVAATTETTLRDRRLRGFVDRYLAGEITVERLAQTVELSAHQLLRWMKRELGTTPQQYVLQRRIEQARRLLCQPGAQLADIALATGFANQPHFTATFRRLVGVTPGQFRERHRPSAAEATPDTTRDA